MARSEAYGKVGFSAIYIYIWLEIIYTKIHIWGTQSFHFAKIRFFVPNPFSESKKWTKINVHFWKSQNTFGKSIICDHNEKLSSQHKKNNPKFVTLIFFDEFFRNYCVVLYYEKYNHFFSKNSQKILL
jgi:hypothetical protein